MLPSDIDRLTTAGKFNIATFLGSGSSGLWVNQGIEPTDDLHFRKAVALAADKKGLIQVLSAGKSPLGIGPLTPVSWAWNPILKGIDYNLEEAKKELALSKYPKGTKLEMAVSGTTPEAIQIGELWKALLKKIDVDATISPLAGAEYSKRNFLDKTVPLADSRYTMRVDPDGNVATTLNSKTLYNSGHRDNKELDDLILKARQTYAQQERKALYDKIQQIAIDQVYKVYTHYGVNVAASVKGLGNFESYYGAEGQPRYKALWMA